MADLINDAKAKPGHYAFCREVVRGEPCPAELLTRALGLKFRHVPTPAGAVYHSDGGQAR